MPAFLLKYSALAVDLRIENSVKINIHKVAEIAVIAACDGVNCFVRICHGVEEGIERALCKLDKRVFDREFSRAAQHRMLYDVSHARRILWRRAECNIEYFIVIIIRNQYDARAALPMFHEITIRIDIRQILMLDQLILRQRKKIRGIICCAGCSACAASLNTCV